MNKNDKMNYHNYDHNNQNGLFPPLTEYVGFRSVYGKLGAIKFLPAALIKYSSNSI